RMCGMMLAALGIPEAMGYTKIALSPVVTGLYTLLVPVVVFAILGSSRHIVVAADSATAAILAGGLVVARLLRLGFLADFLSRSAFVGVPDWRRHPGCRRRTEPDAGDCQLGHLHRGNEAVLSRAEPTLNQSRPEQLFYRI